MTTNGATLRAIGILLSIIALLAAGLAIEGMNGEAIGHAAFMAGITGLFMWGVGIHQRER